MLSSLYAPAGRLPAQPPRGRIAPVPAPAYGVAVPEKQLENLVADFVGSLERPPAVKR
jgi:hypothetical protein